MHGKKWDSDLPLILVIIKQCVKFNISHELMKALAYNDLLAIIIDFQKDEIEQVLRQNSNYRNDEVLELDSSQAALFLTGKLPLQKGSEK